jgi:hypothetical protein
MSKTLKAPNIRELSVPLGGRQFAGGAKSMDGAVDPKSPLSFGKDAAPWRVFFTREPYRGLSKTCLAP